MIPKSIPNGAICGHGVANGRLFHPAWSILKFAKIGRFSKPPRVAENRWMFALGRFGGSTFPPGVRRRLGEGVRFEKRVPRAALRARAINKLIKFKQFIIFK